MNLSCFENDFKQFSLSVDIRLFCESNSDIERCRIFIFHSSNDILKIIYLTHTLYISISTETSGSDIIKWMMILFEGMKFSILG